MPKGDGLVHGTLGGYTNYRCRCQPCRDSYAAYSRDWRARNRDRAREIARRSNLTPNGVARRHAYRQRHKDRLRVGLYGLTVEQWQDLLDAQGGVCAICKRPNADGRNLHIDHDHATGRVRGLLCGGCNSALGNLGDSVEGLERAIRYLQSSQILY